MATTVKRGAGRPAATARTAKAAQQTALPDAKIAEYAKYHRLSPEATEAMIEAAHAVKAETVEEALAAWEDLGDGESDEVVEAARAIVPDPAPEKPMGKKTAKELHLIAGKLGIPGHRTMKRGELLTAILKAEQAAVTVPAAKSPEVRATDAFTVAEKADKITSIIGEYLESSDPSKGVDLPEPLSPAGQKSLDKATAFILIAEGLGWSVTKSGSAGPDHWGVIVRREPTEAIDIEWSGGVFQGDTCYYSHSGRNAIKLRNASAAKKQMAVPPAEATVAAQKVTAHKAARPGQKKAGEATTAPRKALPFDPEAATDAEIKAAVTGRSVSWTNEISGAIEDAYVVTPAANIRVTPGKSGRNIGFVSETGYRTVRVSSIVSIR